MKIPEKAAQHFVYGTYYIKKDESKNVHSISVKGNTIKIMIKDGEKPITGEFKDVAIEKNGPELILKPSSQDGVESIMDFAKELKKRKDKSKKEYFKFQYSGIHVSDIQTLRTKSGIFTVKRSGQNLDENDIQVASPDDFYQKLLTTEYQNNGNKLKKVKVENGNEKIILEVTSRGSDVVLVPSK